MTIRRIAIDAAYRLEFFAGPDDGRRTPILFLHGAFAGAWIWLERYLPWFAEAGRPAYALSFRGHGGSAGRDRLDGHGLADYVEDTEAALAAIGRPAIVAGHSLGGLVAQLLLERSAELRGLALIASVPPEGLFWTNWRLALTDPLLWNETALIAGLSPRFATPDLVRRTMLSEDIPLPQVQSYYIRMQGESRRAIAEAQMPRVWLSALAAGIPALVLAGGRDRLIPTDASLRTAWFHGASYELLGEAPHAMMLDSFWRRSAELLEGWVRRTFEAAGPPGS
jgi:pimeloyl-ACP methyl ester carboxylesterase